MSSMWLYTVWQYASFAADAILLLVVAAILIRFFSPVRQRRDAAHCGGCNHEIGAPIPDRCPECGAELVRAGIQTRRMAIKSRASLPLAVLAWSALMLAGAGRVTPILLSILIAVFRSARYDMDHSFQPESVWSVDPAKRIDRSNLYTVEFDIDTTVGQDGSPRHGTVRVEVQRSGATRAELVLDVGSGELVLSAPGRAPARWTSISDDVGISVLSAAGLDPDESAVKAEGADLTALIRESRVDPLNFEHILPWGSVDRFGLKHSGGGGSSDYVLDIGIGPLRQEAAFLTLAWGSLGVVWLSGLAFLVYWRRRQLRAA